MWVQGSGVWGLGFRVQAWRGGLGGGCSGLREVCLAFRRISGAGLCGLQFWRLWGVQQARGFQEICVDVKVSGASLFMGGTLGSLNLAFHLKA